VTLQIETTDMAILIRDHRIERPRRTRNRRVRLGYPAAWVELALMLSGTVGNRKAASMLGVGMSTLYRWIGKHRTAWMPRNALRTDASPTRTAEVIAELSTRCEHAGIRVPSSLLNQIADRPPLESRAFVIDDLGQRNIAECSATRSGVFANATVATEPLMYAKHEIDSNYATRLSCLRLANLAGMPRQKFIKEFAATFGVPPYHYLLSVRVQRALELLQYSNAPLPVIASTTGFGSAASMQRAFKRFAGASPAKLMNAIAPKREFSYTNFHDPQKLSMGMK
jgi:AraC-like DNA-binding protein